jgi:hypothetical protein
LKNKQFYLHILESKYDYFINCPWCATLIDYGLDIDFFRMTKDLNHLYLCPFCNQENQGFGFRTYYIYSRRAASFIHPHAINKMIGRFDGDLMECCECVEIAYHLSYILSDVYPAACTQCGKWCKLIGKPNRSTWITGTTFREIYSSSKEIRRYFKEVGYPCFVPEPFLRDW